MKRFLLSAVALSALALPSVAFAKPTIGSVSPATATANVAVTLSASVFSAVPIDNCHLYVDLNDVGAMTVANGMASASYTFPFGGSRIAFVFCRDTSGGLAAGPNTALWVNGALQNEGPLSGSQNQEPAPTPAPVVTQQPTTTTVVVTSVAGRKLVKVACPANASADDPCKAVYYIGIDGKRHAYPNGKVFFTWYGNFDAVETITPAQLAAYPLGKNVRYRPGVRMVKFTTLNKVYVVARDGSLHWITSEAVARALYGDNWNTKIDDIADTFYTDYTFGADVDSAAAFSPAAETESSATFD
jgi:hypothetical protein